MAHVPERLGRIAVVPADRIPRVGQTFGSMSLPSSRADHTVSVPRWSDVAPTPWTPTPRVDPDVPTPARDAAPQPGVDDEPQHARYPYTWLHMVVLVLVAFVLAALITLVVQNDRSGTGALGAGTSPTPVAAQAAAVWTNLTTGE